MNKVWLITGASSGFGRAIAEAALADGDVVVGAVRRPEALDDLVATHPDQVEAVRLDVTDMSAAEAVVRDVVARHGRIDVLVNSSRPDPCRCLRGDHRRRTARAVRPACPRTGGAHEGGAAGHARAAFGCDRADEQHGRADVLRGLLGVQRDEVRAGGHVRGARRRGAGVRHQGADRGAGAFRTSLFEASRAGASADSGVYAKVSETREVVSGGDGTQAG